MAVSGSRAGLELPPLQPGRIEAGTVATTKCKWRWWGPSGEEGSDRETG